MKTKKKVTKTKSTKLESDHAELLKAFGTLQTEFAELSNWYTYVKNTAEGYALEIKRLNSELKSTLDEREETAQRTLREREEDRAQWRKEASEELLAHAHDVDQELSDRPWYKKLLGL